MKWLLLMSWQLNLALLFEIIRLGKKNSIHQFALTKKADISMIISQEIII
jgi:hypothetical protein